MADEEKGGPTAEDKERLADTNMENYGSKEHKDLRKGAAEKEPAWKGAGEKKGLQVWRIEKFKVKKWPKARYGEFYSGDSFIVLHTKIDKEGKKSYDVYFWLGSETSQDEAGTAAYKTVELDDLLGDEPIQYREVQSNESQQFLDLWDKMRVLDGGIDSGFNKVKPEKYEPRLLHVTGYKKHVQVFQVKMTTDSLNNHDSFILDCGLELYQFNGAEASAWEKRKANFEIQDIRNARHGKVKEVHIIDGIGESNRDADKFWKFLGGKPDKIKDYEVDKEEQKEPPSKCMLKISDEDGKMSVTKVCDGYVDKSKLESDDAFICDFGVSLYVWLGKGANKAEHREAMAHAVKYLNELQRDTHIPMCRVLEGKEPAHFHKLMKAGEKGKQITAKDVDGGFMGRRDSNPVLRDTIPADLIGAKVGDDEDEEEEEEE